MVRALQDSATPDVILDLHMCVDRPQRFVKPMADAGATRFIFQFEAVKNSDDAIALARTVADSGMMCGVSINPETPVGELHLLLKSGLVDLVYIPVVNPGFGGQSLQEAALQKVRDLLDWRTSHDTARFQIMVDGGINSETAPVAIANILVAGTFLFRHPNSLAAGVTDLLGATADV